MCLRKLQKTEKQQKILIRTGLLLRKGRNLCFQRCKPIFPWGYHKSTGKIFYVRQEAQKMFFNRMPDSVQLVSGASPDFSFFSVFFHKILQ